MSADLALYIHIPFCRRKCLYCSFVSCAGREADIPAYVEAIAKELALRAKGETVPTVYVGGGTPSLLSSAHVKQILLSVRSHFTVAQDAEISMEANPGTVDGPYLNAIRSTGINRLSLGVQSLNDGELAMLGRLHTAAEARQAVAEARKAGFANLSLDLIYGLPGATLPQWQQTLEETVALNPEHLSLYGLTLEEDSPLHKAIERGELPAIDQDASADQYEFSEDFLEEHGYVHYEISNWAKPGYECRHNLVYWRHGQYLGVGVAAHSYLDEHRLANTSDIDKYLQSLLDSEIPVDMDELITPDLDLSETVILGLRMTEGITYRDIWRAFGFDSLWKYRAEIRELLQMGLLESDGSNLRLTRRGRLLGNEVFLRFLPQ